MCSLTQHPYQAASCLRAGMVFHYLNVPRTQETSVAKLELSFVQEFLSGLGFEGTC